ncbi:MAG: glycosyltransferase family A protein [Anaerolineales bacterium]|jgi:glycosyltransferase involved in cell wall biosynthesis
MSVSVIIPILDAKEYLAEAVGSVRAQTYSDWELILVDDGSKDGGVELALEIAAQEPSRVRFLAFEDRRTRGASAARNLGLSNAQGEFIAFLDADDVWLPEKLSRQLSILHCHPAAAMTFGRVHYFSEGLAGQDERDQVFGPLREGVYPPPELAVEFLRNADVYPCPSATLLRKASLVELGGFEEAIRKVRTDLAVWVKMTTHFPVYADPTIVARYRQHHRSSVAVMFRDESLYRQNELAFSHWLLEYLDRLPPAIRKPLEPLACKRMFLLSLEDILRAGTRGRLAWRLAMIRRLWPYRAFRRQAQLLRYIAPSFLGGGGAGGEARRRRG